MNSGRCDGSIMPAKVQPALAAFYDRLERLVERAYDNCADTASVAQRALGPDAPAGTGNQAQPEQPMPEDVASRLNVLLDRLERATERQSYQNRRLNEFV